MFFATTPAALRRSGYTVTPRQLDRTLERFLDTTFSAAAASQPQFAQNDSAYTLSLDLPGIDKSHLTIGIEGHQVRIETLGDAPRQYKAAYEFAQELEPSASQAKLENGVLTLTLSKKIPVSNITQITIQ